MPPALALAPLAYLLGTFPSAILVARSKGLDITAVGSGNPGASNIARTLGARWGVLVFALDAAKGAIAAGTGLVAGDRVGSYVLLAAAVAGHMFPVTRRFAGGKGVATMGGGMLVIHPLPSVVLLALWLAVRAATKRASIASIAIAVAVPAAVALDDAPAWEICTVVALAGLVMLRHLDNIKRLLDRSELPAGAPSTEASDRRARKAVGNAHAPAHVPDDMSAIMIQRPESRFTTTTDWLDSKHSFNFGPHYSPEHRGHGLLLVNNDDVVAPASGFGTHAHRDMEIVTWVLEGALEHRDSAGNHGVLYPGLAQRMSAGSGIRHSEHNPSPDEPVHFVQMWVLPDTAGIEPSYEQRDLNDALATGELVPIASGQGHEGAIGIHQRDAVLWGVRLRPGSSTTVPEGRHVHVFVARGQAELDGSSLAEGAAARLTDAGSPTLTAGPDGAELLIWVTA